MSFPIDQARPVREGEQLDIARLGEYLATALPGRKSRSASSSSCTVIRI